MSYKHRVKRLEAQLGTECQTHPPVIVHRAMTDNHIEDIGVEPQFCTRCGEALPLIVVPPKLSVEEWTAHAHVWRDTQMKGASHEPTITT